MRNKRFGGIGIYVLILVLLYFGITSLNRASLERVPAIDITELSEKFQEGEITKVNIQGLDIFVEDSSGNNFQST